MSINSKKMRTLLQKGTPLIVPGAFNALTAMILQEVGFDAVYMSGYFTSATVMGLPDASFLGLAEMTENAARIANAVQIPLISDADTGYGNAVNVVHTVRSFIRAGVAGIHLEDQILPKRCGHVAGRQLIPAKEAVGKIRAAVDTRNELDEDFLIIARTDARGAHGGGVQEAIRRGNLYREAGADVVFVEGPTSKEEIRTFCASIDAPILYNYAGKSPRLTREELAEYGVAIAILPGCTARVVNNALYRFSYELKEKGPQYEGEWLEQYGDEPMVNIHGFIGFPWVRSLEEKYLGEEELAKYADSIGFQP